MPCHSGSIWKGIDSGSGKDSAALADPSRYSANFVKKVRVQETLISDSVFGSDVRKPTLDLFLNHDFLSLLERFCPRFEPGEKPL